ncbi:MAG TPA: tail fiber protein [Capillimicrobium sp.]|nr:tail fiber protein [Capillimicrobium sp.]
MRIASRLTVALALAVAAASPATAAAAPPALNAPPALTGGCHAAGEVGLHPDGLRPASTLDAAGQLVRVDSNHLLYAVIGQRYGGDGDRTFAMPRVSAPAGTDYRVCAGGPFPRLDEEPTCDVGQLVLRPDVFTPGGYVRADGRAFAPRDEQPLWVTIGERFGTEGRDGFRIPAVTAPAGLAWYLCVHGRVWNAGGRVFADAECTVGEIGLFATEDVPESHLPADGRPLTGDATDMLAEALRRSGVRGPLALPSLSGPVPGTSYGVCVRGDWPDPAPPAPKEDPGDDRPAKGRGDGDDERPAKGRGDGDDRDDRPAKGQDDDRDDRPAKDRGDDDDR